MSEFSIYDDEILKNLNNFSTIKEFRDFLLKNKKSFQLIKYEANKKEGELIKYKIFGIIACKKNDYLCGGYIVGCSGCDIFYRNENVPKDWKVLFKTEFFQLPRYGIKIKEIKSFGKQPEDIYITFGGYSDIEKKLGKVEVIGDVEQKYPEKYRIELYSVESKHNECKEAFRIKANEIKADGVYKYIETIDCIETRHGYQYQLIIRGIAVRKIS